MPLSTRPSSYSATRDLLLATGIILAPGCPKVEVYTQSAPPQSATSKEVETGPTPFVKPEGFENAPWCEQICTQIRRDFAGLNLSTLQELSKDLSCQDLRNTTFGPIDLSKGYEMVCSDLSGANIQDAKMGAQGCEEDFPQGSHGVKLEGARWVKGDYFCSEDSVGYCPKPPKEACKK